MEYTILVDFGSTYTKLGVFDLKNGQLIMTTRHPSTVKTDASIGLKANLEKVEKLIGHKGVKESKIIASSSAAGGLRMIVVGLTPRYSLLAGTNVALGAGARVLKTYSFLLQNSDLQEIEDINPEILLLCGGVENGNVEWMINNAKLLAESSKLYSPVVYAGNKAIAKDIRSIFLKNGKECYTVENIFPSLNKLNPETAREAIRNIFMNRITGMKGLNKVKNIIGEIIMPTPAAVLTGGKLLADGTNGIEGYGESLIFDIGGATTDVYSYADNFCDNLKTVGSPEPRDKRTVEGDLGLRSSSVSLLDNIDISKIAKSLGVDEKKVEEACMFRMEHEDYIASDSFERKLDFILAQNAVFISARRHCGKIVNAYAKGAREIQEGKNLSKIKSIIGTGGPIINSMDPKEVMKKALKIANEKESLLPQECEFYLDKEYILYAVGLASLIDPKGALQIAKNNIIKI